MSRKVSNPKDRTIAVATIGAVGPVLVAAVAGFVAIKVARIEQDPTPTPVVAPTQIEIETPSVDPTGEATPTVANPTPDADDDSATTTPAPTPEEEPESGCVLAVQSVGDTWLIGGEAPTDAAHVELRIRTANQPTIYLTPNGWSKNAESFVVPIDEGRSWSQMATLADGDYVAVARYRNRDNSGANIPFECEFVVEASSIPPPPKPDDARNTNLIDDPSNGAYMYGDHAIPIALKSDVDAFTIEPEINSFVPEMYQAVIEGTRMNLEELLGANPPQGRYVLTARSAAGVDVQTLTIAEAPPE